MSIRLENFPAPLRCAGGYTLDARSAGSVRRRRTTSPPSVRSP
ncbi:MAG TPA: hypothetical protein VGQ81_08935 [Acidobacteriota bacterium]|nr:hypothetical protein [Acidobacteriota bacterium]